MRAMERCVEKNKNEIAYFVAESNVRTAKEMVAHKIVTDLCSGAINERAIHNLKIDLLEVLAVALIAKDPCFFLDTLTQLVSPRIFEPKANIKCIAMRRDGEYIAVISNDDCLKLCDAKTGKSTILFENEGPITSCLFYENKLISGHDQEARVWDLRKLPNKCYIRLLHWPYTFKLFGAVYAPLDPHHVHVMHANMGYLATSYIWSPTSTGTGFLIWSLDENDLNNNREAIWSFNFTGTLSQIFIGRHKTIGLGKDVLVIYENSKPRLIGNSAVDIAVVNPVVSSNGCYLIAQAANARNIVIFDLLQKQQLCNYEAFCLFQEKYGLCHRRPSRFFLAIFDDQNHVMPLIEQIFAEHSERPIVSLAVSNKGFPEVLEGPFNIAQTFTLKKTSTISSDQDKKEVEFSTRGMKNKFPKFDISRLVVAPGRAMVAYYEGNKVYVYNLAQLCAHFSFGELFSLYKQMRAQAKPFKYDTYPVNDEK